MLGFLKAFVQRFMASKSDYPHCIHPACEIRENALSWCDGPLGRHFLHTNNGRLYQVEHCKAQGSPFHEFIRVFFIFRVDGATFRIAAIFDRCPADAIDRIPESPNASTSSLLSLPSINSPRSPSPASSERMQAALGKGGCFFAAHDRIFMPKEGCIDELDPLTATLFGAYDILNTISIDKTHTAMTVPDFASLIEVVHAMAPKYTVNKHQCYWFALIVFLVIRERTGAKEKAGDCIRNVGKWYFIQPNHKASEDKGVAVEEFRTATDRLKVCDSVKISRCLLIYLI